MKVDLFGIRMMEQIVRDWLTEPDLLIFAGQWAEGAVMEIVPSGPPVLTGQLYDGQFVGLRDLLLVRDAHHLHMDLGCLSRATYFVSPSVCYGFRPSFEVRLHAITTDPAVSFGFGFGLRKPYRGAQIDRVSVRRFFDRFSEHRSRYPELVSLVGVDLAEEIAHPNHQDWSELGRIATDDLTSECRSAGDLAKLLMRSDTAARR